MKRVLITGMSGVGKSTIGTALKAHGFKAVDLDYDYSLADGRWDEDKVDHLLTTEDAEVLFVIGAAENQPRFYPSFDLIILVSAPMEVMLERLATRTTNSFGKTAAELAKIRSDTEAFEPLIRSRADFELTTDRPMDDVLRDLLDLVQSTAGR